MSERFLFYKPTITSGWNIFYLHLLIGLITSKIYWRIAKNLVPILKRVIQVKLYFFEIFTEMQTKEERMNFIKTLKLDFKKIFISESYMYP